VPPPTIDQKKRATIDVSHLHSYDRGMMVSHPACEHRNARCISMLTAACSADCISRLQAAAVSLRSRHAHTLEITTHAGFIQASLLLSI
jgi:hypothetical protein